MKKTVIPVALSSAICSPLAFCEPQLEQVFVSATKTEKELLEVLSSATLITKADIASSQPLDLGDLFEHQTNLDIVRTGGRASTTSLRIRGTNDDHTLILINGQRFNSATLGSTQFQFIDPEQIERVEIVRGSRSALYGSDAIGGVVQIFTREASENLEGYVSGETGTNATHRISVGVSDTVEEFYYNASLSHEASDGIDSLVDDTGFNSDSDEYENTNLNLLTGYRLNEDLAFSLSHFQADSEADFDNQFSSDVMPYNDKQQAVTGFKVSAAVNENYSTQLSLGRAVDDSEEYNRLTGARTATFETTRYSLYWQNDYSLNDHLELNAGVDYYDESVESEIDYLDEQGEIIDSRDTAAGFFQVQGDWSILQGAVGIRRDDNSSFDATTNGSASVGVALHENHKLYVHWAEGFKAPTFNDMFWPNAGNPDLLPEESELRELGIKGRYKILDYQINYFETDIENLIDWAPIDSSGLVWRPSNIDSVEISGAELDANLVVGELNLKAGFAYIDPKDVSTDEDLANRARRKFNMDVSYRFGEANFGVTFKAQSKREVSFGEPLPGYTLWGAYYSYEPYKNFVTKFKINNLFNKEYQLNERYNEDGISANIKLVYHYR